MPTYFKLLGTMLFWGGAFIAGRSIAGEVFPLAAGFLRFLIATLVLLVLLRRGEGRLPSLDLRQLAAVSILGLTGVFGYNLCFFTGLETVPAGRAALIIALNPVGIALLSTFFCGERMNPVRGAGILTAVTGALFVISNGDFGSILAAGFGRGELILFGCVLCWSIYSVVGRRLMGSLSPLAAVTYSSLSGTLLLLPAAAVEGVFTRLSSYGAGAWLSLLYLGVFGTVVAFLWFYQGILAIGAVRAGIFMNFVPVCAIFLGYLLLDEPFTPALLQGGALIVTGAWLTNAAALQRRLLIRPQASEK